MNRKNRNRMLLAAGLFAGLATFGGCASDPLDVSYDAILDNLTPSLMTLDERPVDVERHIAYTNDVNGRLFWEDLGRTWYTDHPSRLSPVPIIYTSGQMR